MKYSYDDAPKELPKKVIVIKNKGDGPSNTYDVLGTTYSGSRGYELKLAEEGATRWDSVCHCPSNSSCISAVTSGNKLIYHWE